MLIRAVVWDPPCNFPLGSQMMMATITIGTVWISVPRRVSAAAGAPDLGQDRRFAAATAGLPAALPSCISTAAERRDAHGRAVPHDVLDALDGRPAWVGAAWGMVEIAVDPSAVPPLYYCCTHLKSPVLSESLVRLGVRSEGRGGALRHGLWRGQRAIR